MADIAHLFVYFFLSLQSLAVPEGGKWTRGPLLQGLGKKGHEKVLMDESSKAADSLSRARGKPGKINSRGRGRKKQREGDISAPIPALT